MTWNPRNSYNIERFYHAVEESSGLSLESLIKWKFCENVCGLLGREPLVGKHTYSCMFSGCRGRNEEKTFNLTLPERWGKALTCCAFFI